MSASVAVTERLESGPRAALVGVGMWICLALPPVREILESGLVTHVLIQIPMLAASGALLGCVIPAYATLDAGGSNGGRCLLGTWMHSWNATGVPGILLALFTAAFWMLPRSLDAALLNPQVGAAKLVTLPLLLGLPLALSWPRIHPIGRGFAWANLLPMLVVLGWLYQAAPIRLCNVYLLDEQAMLGRCLVVITAAIGSALAARAFLGFRPFASVPQCLIE